MNKPIYQNAVNPAPSKKERNTSIEILRIISMLMIVFHHFAYHGGFSFDRSDLSITRFWFNLIDMGGKVGVDIFVLISGYFLVEDNKKLFNVKRILKFWGHVAFYSILITLIFSFVNTEFSVKEFIYAVIPISSERWWFASTYFVLYLLHPFINKLLNTLDQKSYQIMLVIFIISWSVIPTFSTLPFQGNLLLWFITLYSIAGYVRTYGLHSKLQTGQCIALWGVFTFLTYASSTVFTILGTKIPIFASHFDYFYEKNSVLTLGSAFFLFAAFTKLQLKPVKWVNIIASATFGVYLIHDHSYVRQFLWNSVFHNAAYQNTILLIPYSIAVVFAVYIGCSAIDLLRHFTIERLYVRIVNWAVDTVNHSRAQRISHQARSQRDNQ